MASEEMGAPRQPVKDGDWASIVISFVSITPDTGVPLIRRYVLHRIVISVASEAAAKVSVNSAMLPDGTD